MNLNEKLRIAEVLEDMGVDIIEAGFPIASAGDFEAVNEIAKVVKGSVVCGLARSGAMDIERAAEAIKPAERARPGRIRTRPRTYRGRRGAPSPCSPRWRRRRRR